MLSSSFLPEDHHSLPDQPVVYKYYNIEQELIYVGKAKSLKKRVSSYFNNAIGINLKTRRMVKEIVKIEIIIVNSELDALLLENNLIKKAQPKYNILLRDDKTYPLFGAYQGKLSKIVSHTKVHSKKRNLLWTFCKCKGHEQRPRSPAGAIYHSNLQLGSYLPKDSGTEI